MKPTPVTAKYISFVFIAVFLSFELHELCHYITGEALGYKMAWTLNSCYPLSGRFEQAWHYTAVSAAGPVFTILQCLLFYFLLCRKNNYYLYPFLLSAFFLRFSAMIISFFNPNDEARISRYFGLGLFTLPVIVSIFLFYFVWKINRQYKYSSRFNFFSIFTMLFFYAAIILLDKRFHIRIL